MLAYESGVYTQREVYADGDAPAKHFDLTAEGRKDFSAATEIISLTALGTPPAEWFTTHQIPTDAAFPKFCAITR